MPIYEYACDACGERMESIQKITEAALKECPACHEPALRKLVSAAAFRLKGSGWYETDFKDKKSRPGKSDKASDAGNTGSKEEKSAGDSKDSKDSAASKTASGKKAEDAKPAGKAKPAD